MSGLVHASVCVKRLVQTQRPSLHSTSHKSQFAAPVRTSDTLVVACTYNERDCIGQLLDELLALKTRCDILVIDDSSTDGTLDVLAQRAAAEPRIGVLVRPRKLGLGSGLKLGWLHARRLGYARIVPIDADLSHEPADVQRLLDMLDQGYDMVVGSRFMPGGRLDYQGVRSFVSRYANVLAAALLRMPLTEYTTSLKAVRVDRVSPGLVESIENDGYSFQVTCIARIVRAGLKVTEIPIHFHDRHGGVSKISRWEAFYGIVNLLGLTVRRAPYVPRDAGPQQDCPVCARPYVIRRPTGALRCLACFGSLDGN